MQYYNRRALRSELVQLNLKPIKNKGIYYLNASCGFDIETTSTVKSNDDRFAFMYIWMLGIGHDSTVFYGRTWEEFVDAIKQVTEVFALDEKNRLVIYVHNLNYEFSFMKEYFEWHDVFAVSERNPIKAVTTCGIEFRDSYILSGSSLESTAKSLTKHNIEKLTGDLDYNVIRHSNTELTEQELAYCENDIKVLTAYIDEQIDLYKDVTRIPMTNTGRVRTYIRNSCYTAVSKSGRKRSTFKEYRKIMDELTVDVDGYKQMKRAFMGGFTHANANHVGETLTDVTGIDFTSAYPSVMLSERFPMSTFKPIKITSTKQFENLCSRYAVLFDVEFEGLKSKIANESYFSESKCKIVKPVTNNGRIVHAEKLSTTIINIDFDIIKRVYEWDSISVNNVRYAKLGYLPKPIIKAVLKMYKDKTQLKGVEGYEAEYQLTKSMLNSIYGMSVTDISKDSSVYKDGEWVDQSNDLKLQIDAYNKTKKRCLYYPWGLWITAYARRNLWSGILAMGDDYIYSDTDSLKFMNYKKHKPYIDKFNKAIISKMETMCDSLKIDKTELQPKTKDGVVKPIGVWDYEGTYSRFKTLGAKRYIVEEDGEITITVSGLSKQNAVDYMKTQTDDIFDLFNENLYIPAEHTGKNTHTYIDHEQSMFVTDCNGIKQKVTSKSGIHLQPCSFAISENKVFNEFLHNLSKGLIYKGMSNK